MMEPSVPNEVKEFIYYIIPEKYRPINQTCTEMIKKMLIDKNISQIIKNEIKKMTEKYPTKEIKYKDFCNKMIKEGTPEIINFFKNLPMEYKQKVNENCRLLVNDELYTPADLLNHKFFNAFQLNTR